MVTRPALLMSFLFAGCLSLAGPAAAAEPGGAQAAPFALLTGRGHTFVYAVQGEWDDDSGLRGTVTGEVSFVVKTVTPVAGGTLVELEADLQDRLFPRDASCAFELYRTRWLLVTPRGAYHFGAARPKPREMRARLAKEPDWPATPPTGECDPAIHGVDTGGDEEGHFAPDSFTEGRPGRRVVDGRPVSCRCASLQSSTETSTEECIDPAAGFVYIEEVCSGIAGKCSYKLTAKAPEAP